SSERRLLSVPVGGSEFRVPDPEQRPQNKETYEQPVEIVSDPSPSRLPASLPVPQENAASEPPPEQAVIPGRVLPELMSGAAELTPLITETIAARQAVGEAHAAYFRLSATLQRGLMDNLQFQARLLESVDGRAGGVNPLLECEQGVLEREQGVL